MVDREPTEQSLRTDDQLARLYDDMHGERYGVGERDLGDAVEGARAQPLQPGEVLTPDAMILISGAGVRDSFAGSRNVLSGREQLDSYFSHQRMGHNAWSVIDSLNGQRSIDAEAIRPGTPQTALYHNTLTAGGSVLVRRTDCDPDNIRRTYTERHGLVMNDVGDLLPVLVVTGVQNTEYRPGTGRVYEQLYVLPGAEVPAPIDRSEAVAQAVRDGVEQVKSIDLADLRTATYMSLTEAQRTAKTFLPDGERTAAPLGNYGQQERRSVGGFNEPRHEGHDLNRFTLPSGNGPVVVRKGNQEFWVSRGANGVTVANFTRNGIAGEIRDNTLQDAYLTVAERKSALNRLTGLEVYPAAMAGDRTLMITADGGDAQVLRDRSFGKGFCIDVVGDKVWVRPTDSAEQLEVFYLAPSIPAAVYGYALSTEAQAFRYRSRPEYSHNVVNSLAFMRHVVPASVAYEGLQRLAARGKTEHYPGDVEEYRRGFYGAAAAAAEAHVEQSKQRFPVLRAFLGRVAALYRGSSTAELR